VETTFEPTDKQNLYLRQPLGVYYARLYVHGKTKWISLKTRSKSVAKIELAKRLQSHYAVRDAEASTRKGNATVIAPGKNGASRHIPLLEPMKDLLRRIKEKERWFRSERRRDGGYILSVAECEEALTNACSKANAHRITHHDLRHLFATRCIESGVDIPTVSRWLGHKDGGALAMRTYGHLRDEHSQAMAAKVSF
jgi:integrase